MKAVRDMQNLDIDLLRPVHVEAAAVSTGRSANIKIIDFFPQKNLKVRAAFNEAILQIFPHDQNHVLRLSPTAMYQSDASFRTTFVSDGAVPNFL